MRLHDDGEAEDGSGTALFCPHELALIKERRR